MDTLDGLNIVFTLLVLVHLLYHRRPAQTLIIWLLIVALLPWFGALIYLLFGSRKIFARHPKPMLDFSVPPACELPHPLQRQIQRLSGYNGIPPATDRNHVALTMEPDTAHAWLLEAIEAARHSICLETYIFRLDGTGRDILQRLTDKAEQGVQVILLLDTFGSIMTYFRQRAFQPLIRAGGQVAFFQPFGSLLQSRFNLRNHRKIYMFDRHTIIGGGINIAAEYLDASRRDSWVDLTFRICGDIGDIYAQTFAQDWLYATGRELETDPSVRQACDENRKHVAQVVPSGPDMEQDTLREALLCAIHQARVSIDMLTPYFIPDQLVLEAVLMAAKRGVRVRLLTPARTDHVIFDWGRASYMRDLVDVGVQVCCFTSGMLHAKAVIVDDVFAMIGSANLDYRSLLINYEIVTFCYDEQVLGSLQQSIDDLAEKTENYHPPDAAWVRFSENLIRTVTPLL